ncbi:hypothetical protein EVAR_8753_1 [Eumeta japonica]|uniref:Uncharacterized protein n=1 Tax=Eumeta variegata TaxID=151549 RepID=A0A4C1TTS7_EUMVA|nr:hypothetical protein EVAR_8753_1 [Eumeta japonica]
MGKVVPFWRAIAQDESSDIKKCFAEKYLNELISYGRYGHEHSCSPARFHTMQGVESSPTRASFCNFLGIKRNGVRESARPASRVESSNNSISVFARLASEWTRIENKCLVSEFKLNQYNAWVDVTQLDNCKIVKKSGYSVQVTENIQCAITQSGRDMLHGPARVVQYHTLKNTSAPPNMSKQVAVELVVLSQGSGRIILWPTRVKHKHRPDRPVKYDTLTEYGRKVAASAITFRPVSENAGGLLSLSHSINPIASLTYSIPSQEHQHVSACGCARAMSFCSALRLCLTALRANRYKHLTKMGILLYDVGRGGARRHDPRR